MLSRRFALFLLFVFVVLFAGESAYYFWLERQPKENPFDPLIAQVAHEQGVDPFLIRALIWRESRFKPDIHGTADEHGLMQVTPDAGQIWAKANKIPNFQPNDLYDPLTNIRAGTWYLNRSIKRWNQTDDPVVYALAEYNAGRSNALKWVDPANPHDHNAFLDRITFASTRKYVEVIMAKRDQYRTAFSSNRWYRDFPPAPASTVTQAP